MHGIGCRIDRGIERTPCNRLLKAFEGAFNAMLFSEGRGSPGHRIGTGDEPAFRDLRKLLDMMTGDIAGSKQQQAVRHLNPSSPGAWSFGPFSTSGSGESVTGTFGALPISLQAAAGL